MFGVSVIIMSILPDLLPSKEEVTMVRPASKLVPVQFPTEIGPP